MLKYPPTEKDKLRLQGYEMYEHLFLGEHFDAFGIKSAQIKDGLSLANSELRYVAVNFAGMLSSLSADMLFEEFPDIRVEKGDSEWLEAFMTTNKMRVQCYESGLESSYRGDVVYRLRSDQKRNLIFEDINPACYFPVYDADDVRRPPKEHVLAWKVKLAGKDASGNDAFGIFMERHTAGQIITELWQLDKEEVAIQLDLKAYYPDVAPVVNTNIDRPLIIHIKNWGINSQYFGISDYKDLVPLMFAVNNRLTRVDSILDKHGDPILAVPEGVLDKDGHARNMKFGLIEIDSRAGANAVPQYIVWDAKLESAFKEIDYLMEFLYATSATSKASFGLDTGGVAESGRALKYKLLRTIAKKHKKELYFDIGMKDLIYTAEMFAKNNNLLVDGVTFKGKPALPQIVWQDGIINDATDVVDLEIKKLDAGLTTEVESISAIDGISQDDAQEKLDLIREEKKAKMPAFAVNPFNAKDPLNMKKDMTNGINE